MKSEKPILTITMGDPAGIGPEIAVKAFCDRRIHTWCRPLLTGNSGIMTRVARETAPGLKIRTVRSADEAGFEPGTMDVLDLPVDHPEGIHNGQISAVAGDVAYRSILKAIEMALKGEVDSTVTCPVNKKALQEAGCPFEGHTEIFAHFTQTSSYAMMLADRRLKVVHVSTHVPLRKACDLVRKERILECIGLLHEGLARLGISFPRIGVAGLNPHAGDEGLFGDEEIAEIVPAIAEAKDRGFQVEGPVPPDTLFAMAAGGRYDGCVAMYHDQGHIPFKMKGFSWDKKRGAMKNVSGVNITLGLPIIRTSVDHGTAFEIAGKNLASPDALLQAIYYASKMCRN
ncbi:MAG: 4-hydroxythreonine-4-phosphate dehydrogenase PdxA [Prolixibacteraceae bacterium]|nr:4-hydroxythreonine-4-phosphate dehydrogenase PdxA [Prolixibacteraceae bacterium]